MSEERCVEKSKIIERFFCESVDIYLIFKPSGEILAVNCAASEALGYGADEMIGQHWPQFVHEADEQATLREFETLSRNKRSRGFINRVRCKDGTYKLIQWDASLSRNGERVFATGRDISESRKEDEKRTQQISLQRAIIDSAEFSIISTDTEGRIQTFNRHAERMLGYTQSEACNEMTPYSFFEEDEVKKYATALQKGFGDDLGSGINILLAKARVGLVEERGFTLVKKSGHSFEAHVAISALRNEMHEVYGFLFVARDVTEERRIERLKNEFISTVSHELRTPMTSVRGALGIIADGMAGEVSEEAKPLLNIAITSADRLIRLINDILDIEKIDSGNMHLNFSEVEVAPLIEHALIANRSFAEKHHVHFKMTNSIPLLKIKVDVDRFAQILDNLLSNAAKYTNEGDNIEVAMQKNQNNRLRVSVTDHGRGIPDSFRPKVFAKFMQANATDKRDKGGTGLGLSICKALVEKQGGNIDFISEEGKGTTFFFEFPIFNEKLNEAKQ